MIFSIPDLHLPSHPSIPFQKESIDIIQNAKFHKIQANEKTNFIEDAESSRN
jgi:hypothetical protein